MKTRNPIAALVAAITLLFLADFGALAQTGSASWYALTSRTASGEMCNPAAMTAAHRTLPFGTRVKVTNLANNRSVIVRINDRGPFAEGRIIDVTKAAAEKLGFVSRGHTTVRIQKVSSSTELGITGDQPASLARLTVPKPRPEIDLAAQ